MLEISHVTKKYRDKEALSDVSLTIPPGQIVGLLGENGAGKTTIFDGWGQLIGVSACALFVIARADAPLSR